MGALSNLILVSIYSTDNTAKQIINTIDCWFFALFTTYLLMWTLKNKPETQNLNNYPTAAFRVYSLVI